MPYNNTPIAPAKEITGHVSLPLARVQKIIIADPNHLTVSKNASFAIALATEMFIQHLATTTHNVVKAERKPRRNIQYRDVSSAVGKTDNLEFLVDVVPKTRSWGAVKRGGEARSKASTETRTRGKAGPTAQENTETDALLPSREDATLEQRIDGQANANATSARKSTLSPPPPDPMDLDAALPTPQDHARIAPASESDEEPDGAAEDGHDDPAAVQLEMEMRGPPTAPPEVRRTSGFTAINGLK